MKKIYDIQISQLGLVSEIEIMGALFKGLYALDTNFKYSWIKRVSHYVRGYNHAWYCRNDQYTKLEDISTADIVGMINTLS